VTKTYNTASLLPLLDDSNPFYLKIGISASDTGNRDDVVAPFAVLDDADPMFRLIGAQILTPAKSTIQSVCLMVQRDQIQNNHECFKGLQNETVVHAWQSAFEFYTMKHQPTRPILHREHISDNGMLLPMSPLFYCQFKERYFHPPCPECSQQLQLCVDDDLLQKNDLQPYTTSLSRYLYCPTCCHQNENLTFYVPSKQDHPQEFVKDLSQLLAGYGSNYNSTDMGIANIPCTNCNELDTCYRMGEMVHSRIIPFCFYPFFMLMFPAITLNARESLRLMSGASVISLIDQNESNRDPGRSDYLQSFVERFGNRQTFFMENDDILFLEILYIKLSFFSKIIQSCIPNLIPGISPGLDLALNRVWIREMDPDSLHPLMWNFKVSFLGVGPCAADIPQIPDQSGSRLLHRLGTIWFYILLVNQSQDADMVCRGIAHLLKEIAGHNSRPIDIQAIETDFFSLDLDNVFWNPENRNVDQTWTSLWNQSLELGISLLQGNINLDSNGSIHDFCLGLEKLRSDVQKKLSRYSTTSPVPSPKKTSAENDPQTILTHILDKWRESLTPEFTPKELPSAPVREQDETQASTIDEQEEYTDIYETVMISADRFENKEPLSDHQGKHGTKPSSRTADPEALGGFETPDDVKDIETQKTIIVPTNGLNQQSSPAGDLDEDLPKTIIVSPDKNSEKKSPFARQIMSNNIQTKNSLQSTAQSNVTKQKVQRKQADEELEKTIIQKPSQKG
jgi:hypothetical protein